VRRTDRYRFGLCVVGLPSSAITMAGNGGGSRGMSTDTAAFAALLNELRGPLTGVAAVRPLPIGAQS